MLANRPLRVTYTVVAFVAAEILYGAAVAALADDSYLALVAVIGLIAAVITSIEPVWGLYLFVTAMFAEGLLTVGSGTTVAKLLGILVFGVWIVRSLSSGPFQIALPLQGQVAVAYVAWGLMSIAWAIEPHLVFDRAQVLVQSIALYVLVVNLIDSSQRAQKIFSIIVVVGLALALLSIFRVLMGNVTDGRVDIMGISDYDPNEQAASLLLCAAILMTLFNQNTKLRKKLLFGVAFSIVLFAILATGSRGAMVSLVTILVSSLILDRKSWQLVLPTMLVGGLAVFLLPTEFVERAKSIVTLSDRGAGRLNVLLVGLQIIGAHPLLGVGWGNFGRAFDRYLPQTPGIRGYLVPGWGPHNIFLGAMGELGVIGLTLFTIMIGITIKCTFTAVQDFKRQNDSRLTILSMGVFFGLLGTLTAGMFVDLRYRKFFWMVLALAEAVRQLSPEPRVKDKAVTA